MITTAKIQTSCPHCDTAYTVSADKHGKRVICKTCRQPFHINDRSKDIEASEKNVMPREAAGGVTGIEYIVALMLMGACILFWLTAETIMGNIHWLLAFFGVLFALQLGIIGRRLK